MRSSKKADQTADVSEVLIVGAIRGLLLGAGWVLRRPALITVAVLLGGAYLSGGWPATTAVAAVLLLALFALWLLAPAVFARWVTGPWSRARARRRYRRRWPTVAQMCGLTLGFDGARMLPKLDRVEILPSVHRLTVRLVAGQHAGDWHAACPQLAAAFGARLARIYAVQPGLVRLDLIGADRLADIVPMLPATDWIDLESVPVGVREDGQPWRLPLLGWPTFLGGVQGSGKSSVIWSLITGLAPAIRRGLVAVWAVDPKGGMELGFGGPLFARFAYRSTETMVQQLEAAVKVMDERCGRLAGVTRRHEPTEAEPLILVLVDELSTLTAYEPDVKIRNRAVAAVSALLARGRAAAVVVVAAAQDPRKEVVGFRSLFPVRVALRLDTSFQVDMVLGDGIHALGAAAEEIPAEQPGVAYVCVDGQREPMRVRAAYVTDDDIHTIARDYPAPHAVVHSGAAERETA